MLGRFQKHSESETSDKMNDVLESFALLHPQNVAACSETSDHQICDTEH